MSETEQKEKLLKRVEFGKYALKKKFENILSQLGVYEIEDKDYVKFQKIIFLCEKYFEKHNIKDRDINKLPNRLKRILVSNFYKSINKRISTLSEESKIFFMIDMHAKHIGIKESIETKDIKDVISAWTEYIMLAIVSGYMGTGKTDFSLKIAEWLWKYGGVKYVISNIGATIKDSKYAPFYFEVSRLSELILLMYRYKDSKKVFIFDEASIHISHRRAMSEGNISIINLAKLIRKLNTHFILITQRAEGVDKDLRELATLWLHKEKKDRVFVKELFGAEQNTYYIDNVEKTEIEFDTNDPADFIFDIGINDILKIMQLISKNVPYEEFEQYINELVNKNNNNSKKQKPNEYLNNNTNTPNEKPNKYIKENEKPNESPHNIYKYQSEARSKKTNIYDDILKYIYDNEDVKLQDLMKFIGKSKTRTYEIICDLCKKGLVYRNGKGKNTYYKLTEAGKYYVENKN